MEHYARLLNVEFEWESDLLPEVAPVEGPPPPVMKDLIGKALRKMKCGKAAGPSGIIAEMLKAAGEVDRANRDGLLQWCDSYGLAIEFHLEPLQG